MLSRHERIFGWIAFGGIAFLVLEASMFKNSISWEGETVKIKSELLNRRIVATLRVANSVSALKGGSADILLNNEWVGNCEVSSD